MPDLTTSEININPRRRSYFRFAFRQWAGLSTRAGGSENRPISFELPPVSNAQHLPQAALGLLQAVADGEMTPDEASQVMRLFEGAGKAIEVAELEARIAELEKRMPK